MFKALNGHLDVDFSQILEFYSQEDHYLLKDFGSRTSWRRGGRHGQAFRLSSNWSYFSEECDRLKIVFSRLDYPDKLVNSTITRFIADKASDRPTSRLPTATNMQDPVRFVLPFKDQASADIVRTQLNDLSQKIHKTMQPVFVSQKINQHLKLREPNRRL